jgi:hypothetical protein
MPIPASIRNLLLFPAIAVCVAACNEEMSPLLSAELSIRNESGFVRRPLTEEQVERLSTWLGKHSSGWKACLATPPIGDAVFTLALQHRNGKRSGVQLHSMENWKNTMEASYLDGSGRTNQPCALQQFLDRDLDELRSLLEVKNG